MLDPMIMRARRGRQSSRTTSIPAPVGGWNVRDPLSAMPASDAVIMENWFPEAHQVRMRPGAFRYATINGADPGTLFAYNGPSASEMFLATGGSAPGIFRILSGSVSAQLVSLTEGRGYHCNYATSAGNFLYFVNGADTAKLYNGTTWASITGASSPAITGVPTSELSFVTAMKRRLWFTRNNSLSAWYLPLESVGGALVEFPMGTIFKRGGYLVSMGSWSVDGGDGVDDHSVFVTSEGEVAVYTGSDPDNASTWSLIGLFYVGEPLTRRCLAQFGGDLLYLCKYGLFPLSKALTSATIDRKQALTDKINIAFSQAVNSYGNYQGWQAVVFPSGPFILVNIPTDPVLGLSQQFVMNTMTGAWCKFTGWNAFSWAIFRQNLYFYGKGRSISNGFQQPGVLRAWAGPSDLTLPISANAQQAFNYFGSRGQLKHLKLLRPTLAIDAPTALQLGFDTDFDLSDFGSINNLPSLAGPAWDAATWDSSLWTSSSQVRRNWTSVAARDFYAGALRLQVASASATVRWTATDFVVGLGGVL